MIRNTETSFGSVAKWLHWSTALIILVAYIIIYYLHWVLGTEHELRIPFIRAHKLVGFSVLIFFVVRLYWRYTNPHPKLPSSMPHWQVMASNTTHFMLYFMLIATPLSGYIGNSVGIVIGDTMLVPPPPEVSGFVWLMDVIGVTYEQFEVPFDYFHYEIAGPFLLPVILLAHIGAALYHHYVEKDDVLTRMLPSK